MEGVNGKHICVYCRCTLDGMDVYIKHLKTCEPPETQMNNKNLPRLNALSTSSEKSVCSSHSRKSTSTTAESYTQQVMEDIIRFQKEILENDEPVEDSDAPGIAEDCFSIKEEEEEEVENDPKQSNDSPEVPHNFAEKGDISESTNINVNEDFSEAESIHQNDRNGDKEESVLTSVSQADNGTNVNSSSEEKRTINKTCVQQEQNEEECPITITETVSLSSYERIKKYSIAAVPTNKLLSDMLKLLSREVFPTSPDAKQLVLTNAESLCTKVVKNSDSIDINSTQIGDKLSLTIQMFETITEKDSLLTEKDNSEGPGLKGCVKLQDEKKGDNPSDEEGSSEVDQPQEKTTEEDVPSKVSPSSGKRKNLRQHKKRGGWPLGKKRRVTPDDDDQKSSAITKKKRNLKG